MKQRAKTLCFIQFLQNCFAGIVHWKPPSQAMDAVIASAGDNSLNQYGSGAGLPDLVETLKQKLVAQNGLEQVHVFQNSKEKKIICHQAP